MADDGSGDLYAPKFVNGRYENPDDWSADDIVSRGYAKWKIPDKIEFLRMKFGPSNKDSSDIPGVTSSAPIEELDTKLPINKDDFMKLHNPPEHGIQVMWIGHASMVVQFDGITILTDPVFSHRCSPVQMKGTGCPRYREAPCKISDLPQIDAVIISHDHYDHLDFNSVKDLNKKFGDKIHWFVPEGMLSWFKSQATTVFLGMGVNCQRVTELTWWKEGTIHVGEKEVRFICTPAQHWCQRGLNDMNKRLWCSWVVKSPKYSFFFAGDTGYCPAFKQIGKMYGPFDVSAIPIGAYEPRWYMSPQHVSPEQAVQIFQDVNKLIDLESSTDPKNIPDTGESVMKLQTSEEKVISRATSDIAESCPEEKQSVPFKFIGIHWGTFKQLGCYEHYLEPPKLVKEKMRELGIPTQCFHEVGHGDVTVIDNMQE